jgi:hypothetical protein
MAMPNKRGGIKLERIKVLSNALKQVDNKRYLLKEIVKNIF